MNEKLRILILEDVPTDAELIERELHKAEFYFISKHIKTKEDFVRELKDFAPDLILSDYRLPKFNGLEALAIAAKESPDVPFILVTGALGEERAVEILKSGASDYIVKKNLSRLPYAIHRALREAEEKKERKRLERALIKAADEWRITFDGINDSICLLDPDGKVMRCNVAMQRLLREPFNNIIGKKIWGLLKCIQDPAKGCPIAQMSNTKLRETSECFLDSRWFHISVDPITDKSGELSGAVYIMTDITERKQTEEKIHLYQEQLRTLVSELSFTEERERRQIAMDLHDYIGQALAITKIKLGALQELTFFPDISGPLREIRELVEQAIQYSRSLTSELSPPILYELGLEAAIGWLTKQIQKQHGMMIEFENDEQPKPVDDRMRSLLFQCVRELLINVVKHAQAQKAKVVIRRDKDAIVITVQDDGVGFETSEMSSSSERMGGFGLFSIKERLNYLGGNFEIESGREKGTRVAIVVPLRREEKNTKEK